MPRKYPQLFFLHIPKTAGTSVRKMLEVRIGLRDTRLFLESSDLQESLPRLKDIDLVTGHLWYELRQHLRPHCFVLTFLRDPLERAISSFHYFKTLSVEERQRHLGEHPQELWASLESDDLGTFIRKNYAFAKRELGERQTLDLCRTTPAATCKHLSDFDFELDDAQLERAKENLFACNFVGIVERFDESMALLSYELGWDFDAEILSVNKSVRPKLFEIDEETREQLREICVRDLQLYDFGRDLFERRWRAALTSMLGANRKSTFPPENFLPPKSIDFHFDQAVPNRYGFHEPEVVGDKWVAWTGPEDTAGLVFDVDNTSELKVLVKIAATYDVETFETLKFFVDGKQVSSVMREVLTHEIFVPPNFAVTPGRMTLEIRSKIVCPAQVSGANGDKRRVGAAIESVTMELVVAPAPKGFFGLLGGKSR